MGWVRRLLRASEGGAGTVTVRIPADLATALVAELGDQGLDAAVERLLRVQLASLPRAAEEGDDRVPFWLSRHDAPAADFVTQLRDRMAQRRAGEADDGDTSPPRRPPSPRGRRPPIA
jgi:hypothetical protein